MRLSPDRRDMCRWGYNVPYLPAIGASPPPVDPVDSACLTCPAGEGHWSSTDRHEHPLNPLEHAKPHRPGGLNSRISRAYLWGASEGPITDRIDS